MPVTRRDPRKKIKDSSLPVAASLPGTSITSGLIDPARMGTGTRDGTKFLRDDGTWQDVTGGGGGVGSRSDITITTASLADNATENDVAPLGRSFIPLRIEVDRNCRVRFYQTAAARTADAARAPGTDPTGEHGVILDVRLNGTTGLIWDVTDPTTGTCMEAAFDENIAYAITNESGSTSTVEVIVTRLLLEAA